MRFIYKKLCRIYIILGKDERLKFENDRESYSKEVQRVYDEIKPYHGGKGSCLSQQILPY